MTEMLEKIGFVGIGNMGFPIAETILEGGYSVIATDVRPDTMERFSDIGGEIADTPADVARDCASVHVVVVDDEQVREVAYGDSGLFSEWRDLQEERVMILHGTYLPETVVELAGDAPDGVTVLDAPVSGTAFRAEKGDLTVMVGGEKSVADRYEPIFDLISREWYHLGDLGSGLVAKLANNVCHHIATAGTLEALKLGETYGIPKHDLIEIMRQSSGDNFFLQNIDFLLEEHPELPRNTKKNVYQAMHVGKDIDVALPFSGVTSQLLPEMLKEVRGETE